MESGDLLEVKRLLKAGAQLDSRDGYGTTPFISAPYTLTVKNGEAGTVLRKNLPNILAEFIKHNGVVDINQKGPDCMANATALMHCCTAGHIEAVQLLLLHNADVTIRDKMGNTALDYANQSQLPDNKAALVALLEQSAVTQRLITEASASLFASTTSSTVNDADSTRNTNEKVATSAKGKEW